ncbi:MAG: hypothetical protein HS108_13495 [Planctomycetes bacterium]|jgi:hypothetical protein|nr:hypothetical protein [Planctomycetota bacterium]MCL4730172.1 hypothetical protein [Planctomycetota bacterium]
MKRWIPCIALLAALGGAPLVAQDKNAKDDATYRKMESQLESTVLATLAYEDADVVDVVKDIAKKARVTIVWDKEALKGVSEDDRKITLELADIKASNALNIVLDQVKLKKAYKNGVLYLTTEEKAQEATITKTYDVRDITVRIEDFPAPRIRLKAADDSTSGPVIELPPDKEPVVADDIVELIEESIKADWGGKHAVKVVKGNLIVTAPRNVHKEVDALLAQLRSAK